MELKKGNESLHAFYFASMTHHLKFSEERFFWQQVREKTALFGILSHILFPHAIQRSGILQQALFEMLYFSGKWRYSRCLEQIIPLILLSLIPWHYHNTQILIRVKTQSYCWFAVLQYRVKIKLGNIILSIRLCVMEDTLYCKYTLNFDYMK